MYLSLTLEHLATLCSRHVWCWRRHLCYAKGGWSNEILSPRQPHLTTSQHILSVLLKARVEHVQVFKGGGTPLIQHLQHVWELLLLLGRAPRPLLPWWCSACSDCPSRTAGMSRWTTRPLARVWWLARTLPGPHPCNTPLQQLFFIQVVPNGNTSHRLTSVTSHQMSSGHLPQIQINSEDVSYHQSCILNNSGQDYRQHHLYCW
jgi:hypothetical protein